MLRKVLLITAFSAAAFAASGEAIYKKCVACHGADAKMVYAGKVPAIAGKDKAFYVESLKEYQKGTKNNYGMGAVMSAQAKIHLKSDADIEAVAEYLQGK